MMDSDGGRVAFRNVRYRTATNSGQLWSQPTRLFFAEVFSPNSQPVSAAFYDHTRYPQNLITVLAASANGRSNPPFPPKEHVILDIERGVYVSFSQSASFTGGATIGYSP